VAVVVADVVRLGELHLGSLGVSHWISDGSGVDGIRVPDSGGSLDADAFDLAWLDVEGEVRQPLMAAAGTAFEFVAPVREFPSYRGQRHFPGLYWAASLEAHVGFESWLERDHAILLDFDPQVVAFSSQPFWLRWHDAATGRTRMHAPDFFARLAGGVGLVVDCRPSDRIDDRSAVAFAAMGRACDVTGWGYRLVGEIDAVRVANLRWLAGYRHSRFDGEPGMATAVRSAFWSPAPLVSQAAEVGDPIAVLPVVFHLLWQGLLAADLSRPLSDDTLVCRAEAVR
jgi:hypothetical protein